jgi:hypothetical protein
MALRARHQLPFAQCGAAGEWADGAVWDGDGH